MSKKGFQGSSPRSNPGIPSGTSTVQTDILEKLCDILVAIESPVAVESSFAQIGCIVGEDGVQTGVVMACKKPDGTFELWNFTSGQPPVGGYDGPWEVCNNLTATNLLLEEVIEKLCDLVGDPEAPCPDCEDPVNCDVNVFLTYAQPEFVIDSVLIGGVDVSDKFTLPVDGNIAPELAAFKDELVACLEAEGYTVTEIQGRDGWSLDYNGEVVEVGTTGAGNIPVTATNCSDEEEKEQVVYENSDNTTELTVSVGGNGDIKFDAGSGDGSESEVVSCIESCLAAGDDVVVTWTTVDGGSGSATLLSGAETNAFPNFYNQSTDASGDSGKLLTLTCG